MTTVTLCCTGEEVLCRKCNYCNCYCLRGVTPSVILLQLLYFPLCLILSVGEVWFVWFLIAVRASCVSIGLPIFFHGLFHIGDHQTNVLLRAGGVRGGCSWPCPVMLLDISPAMDITQPP